MREIGEVGAVQSFKFADFFPKLSQNVDKQELLGFLWQYQPIDMLHQPAHPKCLAGMPGKPDAESD